MEYSMNSTIPEVISILERFLSKNLGTWDWDDFISINQEDRFIDELRSWACDLYDNYPPKKGEGYCNPDGVEQVKIMIEALKKLVEAQDSVIYIINNRDDD